MAHPNQFVYDFRLAISNMLDASDDVQALVSQCTAMGWEAADFDTALVSADITSTEFYAAVEACGGLKTGFEALANTLAKMRQ